MELSEAKKQVIKAAERKSKGSKLWVISTTLTSGNAEYIAPFTAGT